MSSAPAGREHAARRPSLSSDHNDDADAEAAVAAKDLSNLSKVTDQKHDMLVKLFDLNPKSAIVEKARPKDDTAVSFS
eukprot:12424192-Karenia_brevis.AAC.1